MSRPQCIFLNGLPGSGKSTVAAEFVKARPHWLNLDIDLVRTLLGIAAVDFVQAGAEVRPLALAMLDAQLTAGRNVIVPQLFFTPAEAADFEAVAVQRAADFLHLRLDAEPEECWRRVVQRALATPEESIERAILEYIEREGGQSHFQDMERQLETWSGVAGIRRVQGLEDVRRAVGEL